MFGKFSKNIGLNSFYSTFFSLMYYSHKDLIERTPTGGLNRFQYLQALITEYQDTKLTGKKKNIIIESKQQIIANLANFAYDPINYDYFTKLNIVIYQIIIGRTIFRWVR